MSDEPGPDDADYYELRHEFLSQGDIFRETFRSPTRCPLGARRFLSGPFEVGAAMLITPTCSMRVQGAPRGHYAHPVRTLVPVRPLDEELVGSLRLDAPKLNYLRKYDRLINYMYLPAGGDTGLPESLAFLYMPVTLHHDMIDGERVTQLGVEAARQLHRKLVWFNSGLLEPRARFEPPLD